MGGRTTHGCTSLVVASTLTGLYPPLRPWLRSSTGRHMACTGLQTLNQLAAQSVPSFQAQVGSASVALQLCAVVSRLLDFCHRSAPGPDDAVEDRLQREIVVRGRSWFLVVCFLGGGCQHHALLAWNAFTRCTVRSSLQQVIFQPC
jgi:hypothetical protein